MSHENTVFEIKAYTKSVLAMLYGVSDETFKKWVASVPDMRDHKGRMFTPIEVEKIVNHLGKPSTKI